LPFLPILSATVPAAAPAPSAEDRALFAAFRGICRNLGSHDRTGKAKTGTMSLPDGAVKYLWKPGWKDGHSVAASPVAATDPISQKFGLKGQVLTAQAIGRISQ